MNKFKIWENGKEGTITLGAVSGSSAVKVQVIELKFGGNIISDVEANVMFTDRLGCILVTDGLKLRITKFPQVIDYIWDNSTKENSCLYKFTTEYKNNYCE